jgi:hypothetical protein
MIPVAGHHAVVAAISIGQQNLIVVLQKILRLVATAIKGRVESRDTGLPGSSLSSSSM